MCCCEHCGENLRHVQVEDYERRTRIDIVFEKRIEHTDAEIKTCPSCECVNKGAFAADLAGPEQYGLGVKAFVLNLLVADGFIQSSSDVVEESDRTGNLASHHAQVHPAVDGIPRIQPTNGDSICTRWQIRPAEGVSSYNCCLKYCL